ncbi:MAG: hypothetical protein ABIU18_06240 [Novosphingobium sp.]
MPVAGTYEVSVKSPMGDQNGTFTVVVDGDSFSGSLNGGMGSMDITGGKVSGDSLSWSMDMKVPMPMTLECTATVNGDAMTGDVKAGVFGSMPLTGKRVG